MFWLGILTFTVPPPLHPPLGAQGGLRLRERHLPARHRDREVFSSCLSGHPTPRPQTRTFQPGPRHQLLESPGVSPSRPFPAPGSASRWSAFPCGRRQLLHLTGLKDKDPWSLSQPQFPRLKTARVKPADTKDRPSPWRVLGHCPRPRRGARWVPPRRGHLTVPSGQRGWGSALQRRAHLCSHALAGLLAHLVLLSGRDAGTPAAAAGDYWCGEEPRAGPSHV